MEVSLEQVRESAIGKSLPEEELNRFHAYREEQLDIVNRYGETTHVYLYYPEQEKNCPAMFNLHGGGFVKGHRDQDTVFCRNICQNANCVVIDIDYRTAPEKRYPYALHESYDMIKHFWDHAPEYGLDRERFVIAGHSAGGTLALGVSLMMQEENEFSFKGLICNYPPVDLHRDPAKKRLADDPTVRPPIAQARKYNDWYADPEQRCEALCSPALASDEQLGKLPPVLLITAGHDVLGEEAEQMAYRMLEAGTTVLAKRVIGAEHGFVIQRRTGHETAEKLIFAFLDQMFYFRGRI